MPPSVQDTVHDGVLYARSVWRHALWGTPLHKPTLIDEDQQLELRHLGTVMAAATDRQCACFTSAFLIDALPFSYLSLMILTIHLN